MARGVVLLTNAEKDAIRDMPCSANYPGCWGTPPFPDGSRCHPHRIVPENEGGQYVKGNVVPRCPSCHAQEPGHHRQFTLGAYRTGCKHGFKGGRRVHELHPELARRNAHRVHELYPELMHENLRKGRALGLGPRRCRELHPEMARENGYRTHKLHPEMARENGRRYGHKAGLIGGRRVHELHPELCREASRKGGRKSGHVRGHVRHGIVNLNCPFCQGVES